MADSLNLKNLKAAYAEWGESKTKGKMGGFAKLMADNIKLGSVDKKSAGLEFAAARTSKQDAIDYLNGIFKHWEMIYFRPETYVEQGDTIAMFGRCSYKSKATGKKVVCRISNLWKFKNGKAVSLIDLFDSAKAAAAATPTKKPAAG